VENINLTLGFPYAHVMYHWN